MKAVFFFFFFSTAQFRVMGVFDAEQIKHLRYPLIVKPVDCNSSKGVKRVDAPEMLEEAFREAVQLSRTGTAIVEEFIEGPELSVDVYVENGVAHVLSVSELDKIPGQDTFVIFRSKSPGNMSEKVYSQICKTAQQIADAFGLRNAPMLIQMISDGEQAYVLEFSARTGGGEKFMMIKRVSGFDVVKAVVDLTLGQLPHVQTENLGKKYFASEFIYCRPGVFDRIEGDKELLERGILCDFYPFKSKGSVFDKIQNSGDRVAGYSMIANSKEELEEKHNAAVAGLKVLDTDGVDIMRHDILTELYPHM